MDHESGLSEWPVSVGLFFSFKTREKLKNVYIKEEIKMNLKLTLLGILIAFTSIIGAKSFIEPKNKLEALRIIESLVLEVRDIESTTKDTRQINTLMNEIGTLEKKWKTGGRIETYAEINNKVVTAVKEGTKKKETLKKPSIAAVDPIDITVDEKRVWSEIDKQLQKELEKKAEEERKELLEKEVTKVISTGKTQSTYGKHQLLGDISHYGYSLHGSKTATGGRFNEWGMTAAHKTLPFGTIVKVTNKANGKSVTVRINDRGPYIKGRTFDLSRGAFLKIAPQKQGIIRAKNVSIEILKIGNGKRKENR